MKPLLRSGVSPWTLLVFIALFRNSHAECLGECGSNVTSKLMTTSTTISFESPPNCTISIGSTVSVNGSLTGLSPGTVYEIVFNCSKCCVNVTLKPGVVRNLTVTNVTTSSVSVNWIKPEGNSSSYRVQWTGGHVTKTENVSKTSWTISNLAAGVKYEISVSALADDNHTEGQSSTVTQYTRPGIIGNYHIVSQNTSSISLNWTPPPGEVFMYRLEWHNGGALMTRHINDSSTVLSELISGTEYTITVTAVAGDSETEGDPRTFTSVTTPEAVRDLNVTNVTTSSVSVIWSKPEGNSSSYRVQWTGGHVTMTENVSKTSWTISNLAAGVKYEINVSALADDNHTEGQSSTVTQYTRPGIIGNYHIVSQNTSSISLNWTPPPGEVFMYRLEWHNGGALMTRHINDSSTVLSELISGTEYTITVTAVAGDSETEGDPRTFTSVTRPEAVRDLNVTNVTTSSVSVIWSKPEGNSSSYRVQWTGGHVTKTENVSKTSWTISNLAAGVKYEINVSALADDNHTEGQSSTVTQYTRPGIIGNYHIVSQNTSSISLDWTPPPGEVFMYRLEWHNGGALMTRHINDSSAVLSELISGTEYTITVTAVAGDSETEGDPRTFTSVTRPEAVRDLSVTNVTTSSVSVIWSKPEGNSSSYRVQWTGGHVTKTENVSKTSWTISNLAAGVKYEINVSALADDNHTEGQSSTVTQYTRPGIIGNYHIVSQNTSSISLNWTPPPGEVFMYRLEWHNGGALMTRHINDSSTVLSELISGTEYTITVTAIAGDNETEGDPRTFTSVTRPEAVRDLNVTNVTTSSVSVIWSKPEGNSSSYRVQWTGGHVTKTENVSKTSWTISNLAAGVKYEINVSALADDNHTEGQSSTVTQYTRPEAVRDLSVTKVTTSSVSVSWTKPEGHSSTYRVEWRDSGSTMTTNTSDQFAVLSELKSGTTYTISVTAVAEDNKTEGDPKYLKAVTKPQPVDNLTVTNVTTSSVSLKWEPKGSSSFYTVQWTNGSSNVSETFTTIYNLTAGVAYAIFVTAVADDNHTMGQSVSVSQHTRPTKPESIAVQGTSAYLNISWVLPEGTVDRYIVNISNIMLEYFNSTSTAATTAHFTDLKPGRIYNTTVTAVAGALTNTSDLASFATYPTPPESLNISERTNSSLQLNWVVPVSMEGAPGISYHITHQPMDGEVQKTTTLKTELSSLSSGIRYNITVVTVGPQNLKSTAVYASSYTLPNPVWNLTASPLSATSIKVEWFYPDGAQPYYKYLIKANSATGKHVNTTTDNNSTDLTDLEPGSRYNISVTTIINGESGIKSKEEETFSYTMPKAVTNLIVSEVNKTAIQLTWLSQSDYKPSYSYLVIAFQDGIEVQKNETKTETYTFFHLTPGKLYTFLVFTVVEGVKSEGENTSSFTRPEAVSIITVTGNTTAMAVKWTQAFGGVLSYDVLLYKRDQLLPTKMDLPNTTQDVVFVDLEPGVLYCAVVSTKSGSFQTDSPKVCNATFPTPPGPIAVEFQTEESINFIWPVPDLMNHTNYSFSVSSIHGTSLTANNSFLLGHLESGSLYNISVVTVGVSGYQSTPVTAQNYTRPLAVINLTETEITTNAVTLEWKQLNSKPHYTYEVKFTNGSYSYHRVVNMTTDTVDGLSSGSHYSFTVTTQTADGTQASPVTVSYFTRPYAITSLEAETLDMTTVNLTWMQPLEYKKEYAYQVETTGCGSQKESVVNEIAQISRLIPGTNCTFCVSVRAENGIEGEAVCISQYTKPEAVQPSISSQGSNSSVLVSWSKPHGNVEHYKVYLNRTSSPDSWQELNSTTTSLLFYDLSAGMLYTTIVVTYSGPFNATSGPITNATFPNPPGSIENLTKTTSSITIRWNEAPLMTGASFFYKLISTQSQGSGDITTNNTTTTNYTFATLLPGTSYNISITTVGPRGFESEVVHRYLVTTKPLSVETLVRKTEENNMTVTWERSADYKEGYRYIVEWRGQNGLNVGTTDKTEYTINNLEPGTNYSFEVTTETSDSTRSAPSSNFNCTKASPVKDLTCTSPNEPNAQISLSWTTPSGLHSGFLVRVNDSEIHSTNTCCNYTVSNLKHFTYYSLYVETLSCGLPSIPVSQSCHTGITVPPIPLDYESLLVVTERVYNKFSLQIERRMLDGTNGPVTHVGVLVTENPPGNNLSSFLGKTYHQWRAKETEVYLATIEEVSFQSRSGEGVITIIVGDETTWKGYTNGPLDATEKYQYAIVFFTHLETVEGLVDVNESLFSITSPSFTIELPQDPAVIGLAVGVTLGIFCILFIILIGFIIYWRRLSNKESSDIQIHSMRAKVSVAVRMEDYEDYYKKQKADSNCGFAEEFEDLKLVGTGQSKTSALTLENKPKNRYNNVLPYDSSRVKLSIIHGSPYDDYINANYMPGYNSRKEFIAAQGPLPTTVNEFWRMIWEKNVQTLVMLTRCNEQGRVKCEQYWSSDTKHFDNITVTTTSEIPLEDWTIRDFDIKNVKTAETRAVRHFHFTAWPDHGVPETTELLISFRHLVREHMDQYSRHSPTVVHCSAGVGRTGTFISIDRLIFQIERENIVDVYGIVHDLRMHRPLMVQTEDQYVFLNQCAMDIIRARTGTNVDLIYQNTAALSIYENVEPKKGFRKNGYHNA